MTQKSMHVMLYHSTARMPIRKADTIRGPDRKMPVRCDGLREIIGLVYHGYQMVFFIVSI